MLITWSSLRTSHYTHNNLTDHSSKWMIHIVLYRQPEIVNFQYQLYSLMHIYYLVAISSPVKQGQHRTHLLGSLAGLNEYTLNTSNGAWYLISTCQLLFFSIIKVLTLLTSLLGNSPTVQYLSVNELLVLESYTDIRDYNQPGKHASI